MKNYFVIEENPTGRGFFLVWNHSSYPHSIKSGSFGVIPSRVLGISFSNYLRLCRDEFGATIIGKNSLYPTPFYKIKADAKRVADYISSYIV